MKHETSIFASWKDFRWYPKTNTWENPGKILDAQRPPGVIETSLPTPRFHVGQRIRFAWGDEGVLEIT